jgi:DNA-directed RNA polymerase I subunit RPA1
VKRIQNPLTFDTLLHPIPSGLYDPALGAWGNITYVHLTSECIYWIS